uniref:Uncharacterized protein n=1 Tax=Anguilla anguilla TaxID=7936 RepID=A0A0E9UIL8_ANGAN
MALMGRGALLWPSSELCGSPVSHVCSDLPGALNNLFRSVCLFCSTE